MLDVIFYIVSFFEGSILFIWIFGYMYVFIYIYEEFYNLFFVIKNLKIYMYV